MSNVEPISPEKLQELVNLVEAFRPDGALALERERTAQLRKVLDTERAAHKATKLHLENVQAGYLRLSAALTRARRALQVGMTQRALASLNSCIPGDRAPGQ